MNESIHGKLRWKKVIYRGPSGCVCKDCTWYRRYMVVVYVKVKN